MKINKKVYGIPLTTILAIAFVTAGLGYYALATYTINVNQPISITGDGTQTIDGADCDAGTTCNGNPMNVVSDGSSPAGVVISDDSGIIDDVDNVEYVGTATLTKKTGEFGDTHWTAVTGDDVTIEYTVVGDEFSAEVTSTPKSGYELIYYKDNSNRFTSPATARKVSWVGARDLPFSDDGNVDEYSYCGTGTGYEEDYDTCHGAKIWYVPSSAIKVDYTLDWARVSEFYFETELIQFNLAGEITVYPGETLDFTPEFSINKYANETADVVTITVA